MDAKASYGNRKGVPAKLGVSRGRPACKLLFGVEN